MSGAARIFNEFLKLPTEDVVPLTLSHGVDFGQCYSPMDIESFEPIYWAYNEAIFDSASRIKPALLIPHPWMLLASSHDVGCGDGTLVIGPPPGPENDKRMLDAISTFAVGEVTVLVKARGNYKGSEEFWKSHGINTVCADQEQGPFYLSLFDILSRYRRVVAGTFSSAVIFAAAIGREVRLLTGYRYKAYFPINYLTTVDFRSNRAKAIVKAFCCEGDAEKQRYAKTLLGGDILGRHSDSAFLEQYLDAVLRLRIGCYGLHRMPYPIRRLLFSCAARLGMPSIAKLNRSTLEKTFGIHRVLEADIDELSIWLNSSDHGNFMAERHYIAGVREPGFAVCQYSAGGRAS